MIELIIGTAGKGKPYKYCIGMYADGCAYVLARAKTKKEANKLLSIYKKQWDSKPDVRLETMRHIATAMGWEII